MDTLVSKSGLADGACHSLQHAVELLIIAAGLYARGSVAASFAMAVLAREEHGRFTLLYQRFASTSDSSAVSASELSRELRDHKPKLSAGQFTTPVPMTPSEHKEWAAACLAGDNKVTAAISDRLRALAAKLKPDQVSALHSRRMAAQYVDIDPDSGTWTTPASITTEEVEILLHTVHAELANTLIAAPQEAWLREAQSRCDVTLPQMGDFSHRFSAAANARTA